MDAEIYVFPKINSAPLKIAFSTALFILVFCCQGTYCPTSGSTFMDHAGPKPDS